MGIKPIMIVGAALALAVAPDIFLRPANGSGEVDGSYPDLMRGRLTYHARSTVANKSVNPPDPQPNTSAPFATNRGSRKRKCMGSTAAADICCYYYARGRETATNAGAKRIRGSGPTAEAAS